jgi:hypothetical protein
MFLKHLTLTWLVCTGLPALAQLDPAPQHNWAENVVGSHIFVVGLDGWAINTSEDSDTSANMNGVSRLQLANSYPVRPYRSVSAWMRFEGALRFGDNTLLNLRAQNHQVNGSRIDEAALDHSMGTFGVRLGVVDPRISWCRTYDIDSPWVRENNSFCTIKPHNFARSSAPGVQLYGHHILGGYSFQGLMGTYHPSAFGFAEEESPTFTLIDGMRTESHTKLGGALSASHLKSGTEIRLGFMEGDYRAEKTEAAAQTRTVDSRVLFAGLNWYADRQWALRTTHFTYDGTYQRITPARLDRRDQRDYRASTYEVNYQASARDIMALAYFEYDFDISGFMLTSQPPHRVQVLDGFPQFKNRTWSLAWRRDWTKHLFTALQFSQAGVHQRETIDDRSRQRSSNGRAVGIRLGYRL